MITTYAPFGLSARNVFDLAVDWSSTPFVEDTQELGIIEVGKGAPSFQRLRRYTGSTYEFTLDFASEQAIVDFEAFTLACKGRLNGFWMPYPNATLQIKSVVDTQHFTVNRQGLLESWTQEASTYLAFIKPGQAMKFAKVVSIIIGADYETIALDAAVNGLDDTWDVHRLIYARFSDDKFEIEYDSDISGSIKLRIVELTMEYAAIEMGAQPVYLYEFEWMTTMLTKARYASFDADVTISGLPFQSYPIEHEALRSSIDRGESDTTITSVYRAGNPMVKFFPFAQTSPLTVRIYERNMADADQNAVTLIFTGYVMEPTFEGAKIKAKCQTMLSVLGGKFPRFYIQGRCNYNLFSSCCGIAKASYLYSGTVSRVGINNFEVTGFAYDKEMMKDDFFSFGWIEYMTGAALQIRTITRSMMVKHFSVVPHVVLKWSATAAQWSIAPGETAPVTAPTIMTVGGLIPSSRDMTTLQAHTNTAQTLTIQDGQFDGQLIDLNLVDWTPPYKSVVWNITGANVDVDSRIGIGHLLAANMTMRAMLTVNYPIPGLAKNAAVKLYPGCDLTASACRSKFGNFNNFGGHPPALDNLSVKAMDPSLAQGTNKK